MATQSMPQPAPILPPLARREVWTVKETAAYLRCSGKQVSTLALRKELPGWRLGGCWRFYRDQIENLG